MLKQSGIILSLGLVLFISLSAPPQCQAESGKKLWSSKDVVRSAPPLVKITPRAGGKFLLEPLSAPPRSLNIPPSRPPIKKESVGPAPLTPQKLNMISPCDISQLVLSKVRHARYVWGASLENGSTTDCSGFTRFIYRACGINLPRTSAEQSQVGRLVTRQLNISKLHTGDLLFFRQGGRAVGHAGIYMGEGKMVHATSSGGGVEVSELGEYYVNNFVVARRVFQKRYKWPSFPGLSPVARYRDWDSFVATSPPASKPFPVVARPVVRLLKILWPWKYLGFKPSA